MTTHHLKTLPGIRAKTVVGMRRHATRRVARPTRLSVRLVQPVKPAAAYVGGKKRLAATLIEHINRIPHRTYAEPFVGMGGVFFKRTHQPPSEVINDLSGDVSNFFRILQRHHGPFLDMLQFGLTCRREFERLKACDPDTLTDLERAARFLYLQKTAFGGKVTGRAFGVQTDGGLARFNVSKLRPLLEDIHERLSGVVIEALPYQDFINRYDRDSTLFYLDPPYWGSEGYYGKDLFSRSDFTTLAELLGAIKGHFILSLGDVPEVRKLFSGFHIHPVQTAYSVTRKGHKLAGELIITNHPL